MTAIISHAINASTVQQRAEDGYIHATAMCRAAGKSWAHYASNDTTKAYLTALSADIGIPISSLINVLRGGNGLQGTWVHPKVAIHLAQWLSPEFAVQVSSWVFDWLSGREVQVRAHSRRRPRSAAPDTSGTRRTPEGWEIINSGSDTTHYTGVCRSIGLGRLDVTLPPRQGLYIVSFDGDHAYFTRLPDEIAGPQGSLTPGCTGRECE